MEPPPDSMYWTSSGVDRVSSYVRTVMAEGTRSFRTIGEVVRRLGVPRHRVEYVIRTRNIKGIGWAGHARVFSEADVDFIAGELRRIDEERGSVR